MTETFQIPLTRGHVAIIDVADAKLCGQEDVPPKAWCSNGRTAMCANKENGRMVMLDALVYFQGGDRPPKVQIKHKNGNLFDCTRDNLLCPKISAFNVQKTLVAVAIEPQASAEIYKGVFKNKADRFEVRIRISGREMPVSPDYATPSEAAHEAQKLASQGQDLV